MLLYEGGMSGILDMCYGVLRARCSHFAWFCNSSLLKRLICGVVFGTGAENCTCLWTRRLRIEVLIAWHFCLFNIYTRDREVPCSSSAWVRAPSIAARLPSEPRHRFNAERRSSSQENMRAPAEHNEWRRRVQQNITAAKELLYAITCIGAHVMTPVSNQTHRLRCRFLLTDML